MRARPLAPCALLFLSFLFASACGVEQKRSGLPPEAQAVIDAVTADLARGDYEKIYAEAAEEWRQTARTDESRANLERIRTSLGNVLSRAQLSAQERAASGGSSGGGGDNNAQAAGRTLVVSYNTKFERADAIETFALVERSGRWLLARYAVNSNALR
jgi:hypothetical protein